jgi:sialate O-acetylesterase
MRWSRLGLLAAAVLLPGTARAAITPYPLFTDNVVLQQGVPIPVWGKAEAGEEVSVALRKGDVEEVAKTKADDKGRWSVKLPKAAAGTGYKLEFEGKNRVTLSNVAVGEVWIASGQSNMEWSINSSYNPLQFKAAAENPNLRLFTVAKRTSTKPLDDQDDLKHFSKWEASHPGNIGGFSAVAYHFGVNLQQSLKVPVGMIHTSWGGTPAEAWTSREALAAEPSLAYYVKNAASASKGKGPVRPGTPSSLYNAMIHPLLPFAFQGAIWYQGEANAPRAYEYRTLFPTMIQDWRTRWGRDFPFLCVQLAPFADNDANGVRYAELRDAQLLATRKLKNVGIAVITDVGNLLDIHPKDKLTVGNRLALAARGTVYGQKIVYSGPIYRAMKVDGEAIVLSFDHLGGGLAGRYLTLNGFEICGEDREFYPAKAEVKGATISVSSARVKKPIAARYGWKNYPVVNLFNRSQDGKTIALPASPFRTDDFPLTTEPKKPEPKK